MKSGQSVQSTLTSSDKKRGDNLNVYVCKAFRGGDMKYISYIQAISPQMALIEFRGNIDLDDLPHLYFDVRQVD